MGVQGALFLHKMRVSGKGKFPAEWQPFFAAVAGEAGLRRPASPTGRCRRTSNAPPAGWPGENNESPLLVSQAVGENSLLGKGWRGQGLLEGHVLEKA